MFSTVHPLKARISVYCQVCHGGIPGVCPVYYRMYPASCDVPCKPGYILRYQEQVFSQECGM